MSNNLYVGKIEIASINIDAEVLENIIENFDVFTSSDNKSFAACFSNGTQCCYVDDLLNDYDRRDKILEMLGVSLSQLPVDCDVIYLYV